MGVGRMQIQQITKRKSEVLDDVHIYIYIYVKPPDEYHWQGRNSYNSGIFVILKKM
jgi:hypothetical protein